MGKYKIPTKAGSWAQRDISSTLSFRGGKPEDTTHDLLKEVPTQMGTSPRVPFRFMQSITLPSVYSLLPEGGWVCSVTPNNWMHYYIHIRVT